MNNEIGNTVYQQLGAQSFAVMTGAKDWALLPNGLTFKIGRNCKGINRVTIVLTNTDLYEMEFSFCSLRGSKFVKTVKHRVTDVYFDQLTDIFTKYTGLDTHL